MTRDGLIFALKTGAIVRENYEITSRVQRGFPGAKWPWLLLEWLNGLPKSAGP